MQQQHASPHRKLRRNHIALKKMWDVNWQVKQHSDNFLPAKRCTYHRANVMQSMQSSILHVFILLHMGLFPKNMEIISQMSLSKWLEEAASPHRVDHCLIYWYFVMSCQIVWCAIIILSQAAKMFMGTMGISSLQNPRASKNMQKLAFGMIHALPRGEVWSLDFLGFCHIWNIAGGFCRVLWWSALHHLQLQTNKNILQYAFRKYCRMTVGPQSNTDGSLWWHGILHEWNTKARVVHWGHHQNILIRVQAILDNIG